MSNAEVYKTYLQKLLIISAPSGAGKTTLVERLTHRFDIFEFSISATTRTPRSYEKEGIHYYFLTKQDFFHRISSAQFVEWEEVYPGRYYGTLKSEIRRIWNKGKCPIFDVDVEGGLHIKEQYGDDALSIFIQPPDISTLEQRLRKRASDSEEELAMRLEKARKELTYAQRFDHIVVNNILEQAVNELTSIIQSELKILL